MSTSTSTTSQVNQPLSALQQALGPGLAQLVSALDATAVARDRQGGHAATERELLRASGLLGLGLPVELGGLGGGLGDVFHVIARLAVVDSALAHVFAFHHLQLQGLWLYGGPAARLHGATHLRETAEQRLFWGNALNPADTRLRAQAHAGGWLLSGSKSFCSGALGSDRLTVSAHTENGDLLIGVLPTRRQGISVAQDWDGFGQRQTDSGSVRFESVHLAEHELLQAPGEPLSPRATLRTCIAQLIMTHLYQGLAQGAFEAGRNFTRDHSRAWPASGASRAADDPLIQHRYGDLWLHLRAAQALAGQSLGSLLQALALGDRVTAAQRGEVAIAVAQAKVLAHRAALQISSQFFELAGARATAGSLALDRYWRNARVHTLHDPVDYKLRDLGRHALDGLWPEPSAYA